MINKRVSILVIQRKNQHYLHESWGAASTNSTGQVMKLKKNKIIITKNEYLGMRERARQDFLRETAPAFEEEDRFMWNSISKMQRFFS